MKLIYAFIAAVIAVTLILHGFLPHEHPQEIFGAHSDAHSQLEAAFHGEDRKSLTLAMIVNMTDVIVVLATFKLFTHQSIVNLPSVTEFKLLVDSLNIPMRC